MSINLESIEKMSRARLIKEVKRLQTHITDLKRLEDEHLLLSNLGAVLVSPLDYEKSLETAARLIVPSWR